MSCGINACTLPGRMAGGGCGCGARQPLGIVSNLFRQAGGVCALASRQVAGRQSGGVCPLALAGYPGRMAGGSKRSTCKCLNKVFGAFKGGKTRSRRTNRRQTRRKRTVRK